MSANVKKVLTWSVVAFLVFYLVTQPRETADVVLGALNMLQSAAESVGTFFRALAD